MPHFITLKFGAFRLYFDLNYNYNLTFMENSKISTKTCFSMLKHSFQYNLLEKIWFSNFEVTVYHFSTWPIPGKLISSCAENRIYNNSFELMLYFTVIAIFLF